MIDPFDWTPEEVKVFKSTGYKCVHCKTRDAVTLHELMPKSLEPKTWNRPENRIPICAACHRWAHNIGALHAKPILEQDRQEFLNG